MAKNQRNPVRKGTAVPGGPRGEGVSGGTLVSGAGPGGGSAPAAHPFPRQPPSRCRRWKMSAGDRRCEAAFVFRCLPQKAFPCLEDRAIGDRLLKWWEGERRLAGGGWEGGERAGGAEGWGRPRPLRVPALQWRRVPASLFPPSPLIGSLLSIFQARKRLVLRSKAFILDFRDLFQLRSVALMLLEQHLWPPPTPKQGGKRI